MIFNFSVISIGWPLAVDSEVAILLFSAIAENMLVFSEDSCNARKVHCLIGECQGKFDLKNRCCICCIMIHVISVFRMKCAVEFTR